MKRLYLYIIVIIGIASFACCLPNALASSLGETPQGTDKATLRIHTNVPWNGQIETSANSTAISNFTEYSSYSFDCTYNDNYNITLQSAGSSGSEFGVWTVADLVQDNKMLNVGVNRVGNGVIDISGQCHVSHYPMSYTGMVSFTTDKTAYRYGEPVQISGIILPNLEKNYLLSSTILNSNGVIMERDSALCSHTNTFYFYVHAHGGLWKPGNYTIMVDIAKSTAESGITINPVLQNQSSPIQSGNVIPAWFKNTAKLWTEGKITDGQFVQTVQYLVSQQIIKVPYFPLTNIPTQSLLPWVKESAGAWANGQISDDQFVNVLKYLNLQSGFEDVG
jgi:hypothetical protein